jgi:hypothetical protein
VLARGGVCGEDSEWGDNGTRKSVSGGTAEANFGLSIERQSLEDGVVITTC